jgi:outer membrane protein TolC
MRVLAAWVIAVFPLSVGAAEADDQEMMTVEDAVRIAQERAASVISARQDLLLGDVQEMKALANVLPQINLGVTANRNIYGHLIAETRTTYCITPPFGSGAPDGPYCDYQLGSYHTNNLQLGLSASQLLFDGGRWWTVIAQSQDVSRQYRAALRTVQNEARLGASRAYYELVRAHAHAATYSDQIRLDENQLERVKAMMSAGSGKPADVAAVERNFADDRILLKQSLFAEQSARRNLNLALGRQADQAVKPRLAEGLLEDVELAPIVVPLAQDLGGYALARRPDLEQLRLGLEIDRKQITVARADYYPAVTLNGNYGRSSRKVDRVFADPTTDYTANVNLQMQWNLFAGRQTMANVEQAEVNLTKDQINYDAQVRSVLGEVQEKTERVHVQVDVYKLARESVHAAGEAVRLARGLYENGGGTLLELRDAEQKLTLARQAAADARLDLEIAREELRRAVGADIPGAGPESSGSAEGTSP